MIKSCIAGRSDYISSMHQTSSRQVLKPVSALTVVGGSPVGSPSVITITCSEGLASTVGLQLCQHAMPTSNPMSHP